MSNLPLCVGSSVDLNCVDGGICYEGEFMFESVNCVTMCEYVCVYHINPHMKCILHTLIIFTSVLGEITKYWIALKVMSVLSFI
jgi:hypothetical protein